MCCASVNQTAAALTPASGPDNSDAAVGAKLLLTDTDPYGKRPRPSPTSQTGHFQGSP